MWSTASGISSSSATATTTPPESASTVGRAEAWRSASAPPVRIAMPASAAAGIATSGMGSRLATGAGALQRHLVRGHAEAAVTAHRADRALELLVVKGDEPPAVAAKEM